MNASPTPVRILVMEDHDGMRAAMVASLDAVPGLQVVAQADRTRDVLALVAEHRPDVAVLDVRLPDGSGIDVCRAITAEYPHVRCVIATSHEDIGTRTLSVTAGAREFVLKTTRMLDLTAAVIRAVEHVELAAG